VTIVPEYTPRPGDPSPAHVLPPSDPRVAEEVLALLRQRGWDEGLAQIRERIETAADDRQRGLLRLYAGWLAAERGVEAEGAAQFAAAAAQPDLQAWALVGQAFLALKGQEFERVFSLLDAAEAQRDPADLVLRASLSHCRGAALNRQGRYDEALDRLYQCLEDFGPDHFGTGRVLDTLGEVYYASQDDYAAALLFYHRSLATKERHRDQAGMALTHGQLGRLCLDWEELDQAEEHFRSDQEICQRIGDWRGEAQMFDHRAQVLLARGKPIPALALLDESVSRCRAGNWTANEAFARKDRAAALLALDRADEAEAEALAAEELFAAIPIPDGVWYARRVLALVHSGRGRHQEAEQLLSRAAAHFDGRSQPAEAARCWLERAGVRQARSAAPTLVSEALQAALELAERSRRDNLIAEIERRLEGVDEAALYRRLYRRARGRGVPEGTSSLRHGSGEKATMMFFDLLNFSGYSLVEDASQVLLTLNQVFARVGRVLKRHEIVVNQYLGDGFMAIVRGRDHARRAVAGALDVLDALRAFNRPRRVLALALLEARIGLATGDVCFGNVGTHRKVDFTAVGPTTNLASRLQGEAIPGEAVCVSEATYKAVKGEVEVKEQAGRVAKPKNMDEVRVWDVVGRRTVRHG
jgi:class 3 adenylate cyclase